MSSARPVAASVVTPVIWAAVIDLVLVLVFVVIGRGSHDEGVTLGGTLETAWPFIAGLAVGWLVTRAWSNPRRIAWSGIGVWLSTVALGMILRALVGQGVALSFVIVATVVLGVFLLGWRALAPLVVRRAARRT